MAAPVDNGELQGAEVKDYLAYRAKVGELACRYSWQSILEFDNEYRKRQAESKFRLLPSSSPRLNRKILFIAFFF